MPVSRASHTPYGRRVRSNGAGVAQRIDLAIGKAEKFRQDLAVVLTKARGRDVFRRRGVVQHERAAVHENVAIFRVRDFAQHAAGMEVLPWTANTPEEWSRLMAAGVDGIISDDPAGLIAFLKKK